jgi:polyphosphate kinase
MLKLIEREIEHAKKDLPARIIAKVNSLAEPQIIEALYRASQAGVKIDLIVRGICCLRPGVKGLSENITVRSIVDRFLEHSRIYYFENACQPQVFVGSADWLPRNLFRRIEVVFPVEDGILRERIINEILNRTLADNVKARILSSDGSYQPVEKRGKAHRSQFEFIALASGATNGTGPHSGKSKKFPAVKVLERPF